MLKTTLLAAIATLGLAAAAAAGEARPADRTDQDGDRRISLVEMQAAQAERFARLDVNRDGRLTRQERQAGGQALRAARQSQRVQRQAAAFARRDRDRDGALTQAEAPGRMAARFAQFDANRDGRLTAGELRAGQVALRGQRGPKPAGRQPLRADADSDGAISRAEADNHIRARFARLDLNRDGYVTRDERRAHRQSRRGQA